MRRDRRKYIASMESLADRVVEKVGVRDLTDGSRIRNQGEDAVVRRYKNTTGLFPSKRNGPAGASDSGIDNDNMNRSRRKIPARTLNNDGCFNNVKRRDAVRNIDDLRGWSDTENYAL